MTGKITSGKATDELEDLSSGVLSMKYLVIFLEKKFLKNRSISITFICLQTAYA